MQFREIRCLFCFLSIFQSEWDVIFPLKLYHMIIKWTPNQLTKMQHNQFIYCIALPNTLIHLCFGFQIIVPCLKWSVDSVQYTVLQVHSQKVHEKEVDLLKYHAVNIVLGGRRSLKQVLRSSSVLEGKKEQYF